MRLIRATFRAIEAFIQTFSNEWVAGKRRPPQTLEERKAIIFSRVQRRTKDHD